MSKEERLIPIFTEKSEEPIGHLVMYNPEHVAKVSVPFGLITTWRAPAETNEWEIVLCRTTLTMLPLSKLIVIQPKKPQLKYWYCTDFYGRFPVGVAAILVSTSRRGALGLLNRALKKAGLEQNEPVKLEAIVEITNEKPQCLILNDGDY